VAHVAQGDVIVSIDDDAVFSDPSTVARTLDDFRAGQDIGAVAIPYRELSAEGRWIEPEPAIKTGVEIVEAFVGTAYAIRRDLFLELGGFWEFPQGEERDFCARLLQAGYFVRRGTAPALEHRPSTIRSRKTMAFNGRRGDVQFAYRHVPARYVIWHLVRMTAGSARHAYRDSRGRYAREHLRGYMSGWRQATRTRRAPLDTDVYRLSLRLRRQGALSLEQARAAARDRPRIGGM
jgi:hypothetical protein